MYMDGIPMQRKKITGQYADEVDNLCDETEMELKEGEGEILVDSVIKIVKIDVVLEKKTEKYVLLDLGFQWSVDNLYKAWIKVEIRYSFDSNDVSESLGESDNEYKECDSSAQRGLTRETLCRRLLY
jgi:hypothetical protein